MTMRSHAVCAAGTVVLSLLAGCGPAKAKAPAVAVAEFSPTPAPTLPVAPPDREGSAAEDPTFTVSADEGSGIPPGMPEEGSPAYELLEARLCARFGSEDRRCGEVGGGRNGAPRTFTVSYDGGCWDGVCSIALQEQSDGTWQEGPETCSGGHNELEQVSAELRPEIAKAARRPSDKEIEAAKAELESQGVIPFGSGDPEFIDLNHDGQTEFITWDLAQCWTVRVARVYTRGANGRWAEDEEATTAYYESAIR